MLLPEDVIGARLYPHDLAQFVTTFYRQKGVEVQAGDAVVGLQSRGDRLALISRSERETVVDGVVAGIGIQPNVAPARVSIS